MWDPVLWLKIEPEAPPLGTQSPSHYTIWEVPWISLMISGVERVFMFVGHLYIFFRKLPIQVLCCSFAKLCLTLCVSMDCSMPGFLVSHPPPGVCPSSCSLHRWWHPAVSSFIALFFCFQSFSASRSFRMSQLFVSDGQGIGASAAASVLPMRIQGWFPLRLTGLVSLQSKGLWRVFSNTTVQKLQFFGALPSLWSSSHNHTWLLERPQPWLYGPLSAKWCLCFLTLSRFVIAFLPRAIVF